jgi:general secretion pathway protein A
LREKWVAHIESTLMRPIVLIDEAQEMNHIVLNELRILSSARFDSVHILSVVLAGDARLPKKLRHEDLLPLGSRIRARLVLEHATADELRACLMHLMKAAGNAKLMTRELVDTLCDHALGNYRVLTTMANELLSAASERELEVLDEKLYLEVFATTPSAADKPRRARAAARR